MPTDCIPTLTHIARVEGRSVVASFDGGAITSDAGALLLGATDRAIRLVDRFAACFRDFRSPRLIEHDVSTLVGQRVFGLALGYEDLIDHDELRHDPVMAVLAGKLSARRRDCAPVAGKSTLNRLELSRPAPSRYHKISHDPAAIEGLFVDLFLEAHAKAPQQITLDLDATDDPLHGHQEGRFFHAYYDGYCYLPLYIFCGRHLLAAKLRPSNIDGAAGSVVEIARIVGQIRRRWPRVRILLRADSGFCREELMVWCEAHDVDYLFGLARNTGSPPRLQKNLCKPATSLNRPVNPRAASKTLLGARSKAGAGHAVSLPRRSGPAAKPIRASSSPRSQPRRQRRAISMRKIYCARGEMENRIKECQLDLFADRTSANPMRANQLRLWFASMAYVWSRTPPDRPQTYPVRRRHLRLDPPQAASRSAPWSPSVCDGSKSPWPQPTHGDTSSGSPTPCWSMPRADEPDTAQPTLTR
jgi:hypothetical protein